LNPQKLNNKLKRKVVDYICEKLAKIFHKEIFNPDVDTITSNDTDLVKKKYPSYEVFHIIKITYIHRIIEKKNYDTYKS